MSDIPGTDTTTRVGERLAVIEAELRRVEAERQETNQVLTALRAKMHEMSNSMTRIELLLAAMREQPKCPAPGSCLDQGKRITALENLVERMKGAIWVTNIVWALALAGLAAWLKHVF